MATYDQIRDAVRARGGRVMQNCWIAHVKELNGLPMAKSKRGDGARVKPCPDRYRPIIEAEFRRQGMLPPLSAE